MKRAPRLFDLPKFKDESRFNRWMIFLGDFLQQILLAHVHKLKRTMNDGVIGNEEISLVIKYKTLF